ncbi:MAG: hypothetical protein NTW74_16695, partial [Acidobacteria bacterium]|nr:hypothetical protein [Acidobacteriota bacterium]
SAVNMSFNNSNDALYDSMVIKAQKRFASGLSFLSSWTWSRNKDASFGSSNFFTTIPGSPQNSYDLGSEYGLSTSHTPHAVKGSITYDLPFGKNKAFLSQGALLNQLVGGWQINSVYMFQTGFPLSVFQNQNFNSVFGNGLMRPNAAGFAPETTGRLQDRLDNYLNPGAFTTAPQ